MIAHRMTGASDAPVVLYLHGLGIAGWCWEPIAEKLPDFAALMPDFPGHGGSASIPWVSIADTAARVGALVDSLPGDRPVHVTGHSLGAYVGTVLIASRPQRFRSAVLSGFHVGEIGSKLMLKLAYAANGVVFRIPPLLRRFARMFGDGAMAARFVEGAKLIGAGTIRRAGMQVVDFLSPFG
ncbi:MAG: alpha/beta fold hydrolase, partial [Pseudomonadota bacterium]